MWERRLARWLFVGVPCFLVLAVGGIFPAAEWAALGALLVATALHLVHRARAGKRGVLSPLALGGLVALALALLSAVPLPSALLGLLSPLADGVQQGFARAAGQDAGFAPWSLDAVSSLRLARRLAIYALVFLLAVPLGRRPDTLRHVLRAFGVLAAAFAGIAGLNVLAGDGTILGLFRPHTPLYVGASTLVNPNHAAALLGLTLPVTVGLFATTKSRRGLIGWGASALAQLAQLLLTPSGNALVAPLFLAALFAFFALRQKQLGSERRRTPRSGRAALLMGLAVVVGLVVVQAAYEPFLAVATEALRFDKVRLLGSSLALIPLSPWVGVGPGAFLFAHGAFGPASGFALTAAESLPIQVLLDFGVPAGLLLLALGAAGLVQVARRAHADRLLTGLAVALLGFVVHELADFAVNLPGPGAVFFALFGLGVGAVAPETGRLALRRVRVRWMALLLVVVTGLGALGGWLGEDVLPRRAGLAWSPRSGEPAPVPADDLAAAGRFYPLDGRIWMRLGLQAQTDKHDDRARVWLEYAAKVMPQSFPVLEELARAVRRADPERHQAVLGQIVERFWYHGGGTFVGPASEFVTAEVLRSRHLRLHPRALLGDAPVRLQAYVGQLARQPADVRQSALLGVLEDYRSDLPTLLLLESVLAAPALENLRARWLATLFAEHDTAPETWLHLALDARRKGTLERAHSLLLRARALAKGPDARIDRRLAETCLDLGLTDEAAAVVAGSQAVLQADHVSYTLLKARLSIAQGRPEAALAILEHLQVDVPRDQTVLGARARLLVTLGRTNDAATAYEQLFQASGDPRYRTRAEQLRGSLAPTR